jgi:hypothetical protein
MPDIRLVRRRGTQLWFWTGVLSVIGLLVWASAFVFGDATDPAQPRQVGALAQFGAERAPVLPIQAVPFDSLAPLGDRDLGRLVHLEASVESSVVRGAVWVRAADGRRILVRVEPLPPEGTAIPIRPGGQLSVDGYVQSISRAEFLAWMDSLSVRVPRPAPTARFGQLPDPEFARMDAQFVRSYYISVRPEQIVRRQEETAAAAPRRSIGAAASSHRSSASAS